jgi:hypothetical protein
MGGSSRSTTGDSPPGQPGRALPREVTRLKKWIVLFPLIISTTLANMGRADQTRFSFGTGVTSAGTVSGGLVLAPSFSYAFHISDQWELSMSTRVLITGTTYKNPGFVAHNVPALGFTWPSGYVTAGPSLDVLHTILCGADAFCNRVVGVAPGATFAAAYFTTESLRGRLGVHLDAHLSVIPSGAVFSGPIWTVNVGPVLRLGKLTR